MHLLFMYGHNPLPYVARIPQQNLTDLGYFPIFSQTWDIFPYFPYSSGFSLTDKHFFKHLDTFLHQITFLSKREVETAYKDFLSNKSLRVLSYKHKLSC